MSPQDRVRPQTRCGTCHGQGERHVGWLRTERCKRCLGQKAVTYPRTGDVVVFWRDGRFNFDTVVRWEVMAAPEGEDWLEQVVLRACVSGVRREAQAYRLYVLREAEALIADELMGRQA